MEQKSDSAKWGNESLGPSDTVAVPDLETSKGNLFFVPAN